MAVEGDGGIAEQQGRRRRHALVPLAFRGRFAGAELGRGRLAVDDVLDLADDQVPILKVFMAQGHEQQRAGAAVLFLDVLDTGLAHDFRTHAQRLEELQLAAGPHAIAVVRGRQEPTARRVTVHAQACLVHRLLEERPVP
ncbi:hypothetical protein D9M71_365310 [compost metagenome]